MGSIAPLEILFLLALITIAAFFVVGITNSIVKRRHHRPRTPSNMLTEGELESLIERAVDRSIAPLRESVMRALKAPDQSSSEEVQQTNGE